MFFINNSSLKRILTAKKKTPLFENTKSNVEDVLLTLKHTIKEHDCKLTKDIISLIDREADLLMRGIREENLQGLRKRIVTLFLQYIKTPQFNPAAARVLKVEKIFVYLFF